MWATLKGLVWTDKMWTGSEVSRKSRDGFPKVRDVSTVLGRRV